MLEKELEKKQDLVTLTPRHISIITIGLCLFMVFVFVGGYFLGHKKATEQFCSQLEQESLADHIYSSMCVLYEEKDEDASLDGFQENESHDTADTETDIAVQSSMQPTPPETEEKIINDPIVADAHPIKKYQAYLAGFAARSLDKAQSMVQRLQDQGYQVDLATRISTTKKGKTKTWYQVVTAGYADKKHLETLAYEIAARENIPQKDISIHEYQPSERTV